MSEEGEFAKSQKSDFSQKLAPEKDSTTVEKQISFSSLLSKECGFEPPRELPKRSYSLQPDMATGWKPKKIRGNGLNNVFPINFGCEVVDFLIKEVYRRKFKEWEIAYLGPRRMNSYMLHENRKYANPYPLSKKLDPHLSQRPNIPLTPLIQQKPLKFTSNFQCGNLDCAIYISNNQYDLFMRVDTNTKGHTNWYYFIVQNGNFVGNVRFNICNFRRDKSLYERGLRPYCYSRKTSDGWKQGGDNVRYEKRTLRYGFLYQDEDFAKTLKTYLTLSFSYHFDTPNDTVQLAYFIPYSYSRLMKLLPSLNTNCCKTLPSLKSLTGLSIPVLQITDDQVEQYNKRVVIVTGRIHPGESNSSFVCEGFLEHVCSEDPQAKEFRKKFIAYVIPMINPDGVVAGNYRTSLFGKDLNRTFNQQRKYAFPETFHFLQLIKDLKTKFKQRLNLFIDLHGHSVKKNVFMYGPEFNIQHPNYYLAKQLPKIMSTLTPCFRFYSCIFRISSEKSTTARATLNRFLNIPFTYTMESSNGFYYDSEAKKEFQLTSKKLKKIGQALCAALNRFQEIESNRAVHMPSALTSRKHSAEDQQEENSLKTNRQPAKLTGPNFTEQENLQQNQSKRQTTIDPSINDPSSLPQHEILSDDQISEGNSDSQPADQDLSDNQLEKLLSTIEQGLENNVTSPQKPHNSTLFPVQQGQNRFKISKFSSQKDKNRYKKKNPLLPPINCLNRALTKEKANKSFLDGKGDTSYVNLSPQRERQRKSKHLSISQMIEDARGDMGMFKKEENSLAVAILKKKTSKMDFQKAKFFGNLPYMAKDKS